jgi:ABC-2 type transport system permease protein
MRRLIRAFTAIAKRELWRFVSQRARFFGALVRPLIWLVVFAAGFRAALGIAIVPPYQTYITYDVYIAPGLVGMVQLFNGMQSSLAMVYDREMGSMRVLLASPHRLSVLLTSRLTAAMLVSLLQAYAFLLIAQAFGVDLPWSGFLYVLPALVVSGLLLGAFGMLVSSVVKQLENFAGVMNFVVFPLFFMSSALYPLWKIQESSEWLYRLCAANPFSDVVEMIRFALYGEFPLAPWRNSVIAMLLCVALAVLGYRPRQRAG